MWQQQQEDVLLDQAARQIRDSRPDPKLVEEAAERVWSRLTSDSAATAVRAAEVVEIRGCEDYQALIPAYLAGSLPEARKLLVEDHTGGCVPCRRALKEAREGKAPRSATRPMPIARRRRRRRDSAAPPSFMKWALAAILVAGLGISLYFLSELALFGAGTSGVVRTADADLFRIAEVSHLPIAADDQIREGDTIRTGRTGGAVVELDNGSLVEMRERTEMSIHEGFGGTTIQLVRGAVIVQAAAQQRRLSVATEDCLVSVTGTVFSVNHGTKGSRVSVVEGEVRVNHAGHESLLLPGEQVATQANLDPVSVEDEIAWSRDVDRYLELLREYAELRRELRERVPRAELRYESRLLDLVPEDTVLYAAVPNLGETITETHRVIQERLRESPLLAEWWQQQERINHFEPIIDEVVAKLGEFSEYLGEELVVSVQARGEDFAGPLVLAEIVDAAGFRDFAETELAGRPDWPALDDEVTFLDDPAAPAGGEAVVYLWLHDDLVAGSPDPAQLRQVAAIVLDGAENPFVDTTFHAHVLELYDEGADMIVAGNLERLVDSSLAAAERAGIGEEASSTDTLRQLGLLDVRHLTIEQKRLEKTYQRASVTFQGSRRGIASWLAAPAPMGSLDFISPDAKVMTAVVFKDPVKMLDDVANLLGDQRQLAAQLEAFEDSHGLSLRDDFAAVLGGELAFAIDGPLLPTPAWKLVVEVYDPARFQLILDEVVAEANAQAAETGTEPIEILEEEVGGRMFYTLPAEYFDIHYTFAGGYLLAAPSRALLDRAIRFRDSGYSITDSAEFTALMPVDRRNNFSALLYQDVAGLLQPLAEKLSQGSLSEEQRRLVEELKAESAATLGYAYAEEDRITFAAASGSDFLTTMLMQLMGLSDSAGLQQLLKGAGLAL
ncbi:MAG: hypothetical protein GY856_24070 [bacterium]|nr:hypothetical protein [bacterium]